MLDEGAPQRLRSDGGGDVYNGDVTAVLKRQSSSSGSHTLRARSVVRINPPERRCCDPRRRAGRTGRSPGAHGNLPRWRQPAVRLVRLPCSPSRNQLNWVSPLPSSHLCPVHGAAAACRQRWDTVARANALVVCV